MTDKIREAFEKWARTQNLDCDTGHSDEEMENFGDIITNPYGNEITNYCFQAWQAATSHAAPDAVVKALKSGDYALVPILKKGDGDKVWVKTDRGFTAQIHAEQALASLPVQHNYDVLPKTTGNVAWNNPPLPVQPIINSEEA